MTTPNTNTHPAMDACPPLEDIAAFIDGMLPPEERERMTAHLARCESCYEIFAGAVAFQEEPPAEGITRRGVLPFPLSGSTPRRLLLAASIVLTAGVGFFAWQASRPPEITLAGVVDTVENQPAVADHLYEGKIYRNAPTPSPPDTAEFMTGVYLLDLRFGESAEATEDLLGKLDAELKQTLAWPQDRRLDDEQPDLRKLEAEVEEHLEGSPVFSFGLWAEAGRLSAVTKSPEFFERRNNRRYLSQLLKEELLPVPGELQEPVLEDLKKIESLWDKNNLDFGALAAQFQDMIQRIDDHNDDFLDPLEFEEPSSFPGE